jgi:hypothetical protein
MRTISPLECPDCHRPLAGLPHDVVYTCPDCGRAHWFDGTPLDAPAMGTDEAKGAGLAKVARDFRTARSVSYGFWGPAAERIPPDGTTRLELPFWYFRVRPRFEGVEENRLRRYLPLETELSLFVPAFGVHGLQYVGWPGREWDPAVRPVFHPLRQALPGTSRDPFTAFAVAWFQVLQRADHLADISNVEMHVEHLETILAGIPARRDTGRLVFPFSPKEYPEFLLDDLISFLSAP